MSKRILASIDQVTPLRGELRQELYFVALCYKPDAEPVDPIPLDRVALGETLHDWFSLQVTPVFSIHRKQAHVFGGGLPIFSGETGDWKAVYIAVMESDRSARQAGEILSDLFDKQGGDDIALSIVDSVAGLLSVANPTAALVKQAFSLLIKGMEVSLLMNKDDIQYTNVFTMKASNNYMIGDPVTYGNDRVTLDFHVEEL